MFYKRTLLAIKAIPKPPPTKVAHMKTEQKNADDFNWRIPKFGFSEPTRKMLMLFSNTFGNRFALNVIRIQKITSF